MDRLQTMKTFVRVVDQGGFTAAARVLNVDQALVTRQVADLERHLGVKLLERTTRTMRLTEAGEMFLTRCREIVSDISELEAAVSRSHRNMAGAVRLAVSSLIDMASIGEGFAKLHRKFPEITLEVAFLDRPVDPVAESFDVVIADAAFGVSPLAIARPLPGKPFMLCAAPAYLAEQPAPTKPPRLADHFCVTQWSKMNEGNALERWTLEDTEGNSESADLKVVMRTNTYAMTLEAVRCGLGIGRLTPTLVGADLDSGRLMPVLPEWSAGPSSFNLVYPGHRMMPQKVRHVIDIILSEAK